MADTENTTFNTSRVLGNEIVKADDFNFGFESLIHNISKFAQMIFECKKDFVIGGKVTVDSGTNVKIAPIFGVCASTGEPFGMTEQSDVISITQDDYHSRVDIIEAKGEWVTYDEQQRAFNDLDNDIVTYQNIDVKQRLKVTYRVKNGVNDSVVAPVTDEGWVKIAEIKYTKGTVELSESDILNITADVADLENSEWTNEKTKTYNVNYISSVNERFRVEHNEDGTHKNGVVHAAQVDFGTGDKQVNASKIPVTSSGTVGNATYAAGDSVNATLVTFANQITTIYNNYLKYGANCFKGEVALSLLADGNTLKNPLVFGAAGDGTAYCKIENKNIFSITADGKLRMAAGYVPSDSMDVVTKEVTDAINNVIDGIDKRVTTLESTSDSTVYANNVFSRFSYVAGKIDAATTANIALSGLQTVDGISLSAGMLVLVKNQTDAKENGIYEVNSNAWQRHSEFATFALIKHKLYIIGGGSVNKNKIFYTPQENFSGELGESSLTFSEYGKIDTQQIKDAAITAAKLASNLILGGITEGTFKGDLTGNVTGTASNADKIKKTIDTVGSETTIFDVSGSTDGARLTWGPVESDHGLLKLLLTDDANSEFRILQNGTQVLQAINSKCNINGSAAYATSAGNADTVDSHHFNWSGQNGQPEWIWGGNDSANQYVYNPSNFSVNYATSAGNATTATSATNADKVDGYHVTTSSSISSAYLVPVEKCSLGSTSGYIKLANGLIVQWGTVKQNGKVTFPISFSSPDSYGLGFTQYRTSSTSDGYHWYKNNTASSFTPVSTDVNPIKYIAIGF